MNGPSQYEPHTAGCAKCGREMGEHPYIVPGLTQEQVCEAFIDPDFDGADREEDVEPDTFVPCQKRLDCKLGWGHDGPCTLDIDPTRAHLMAYDVASGEVVRVAVPNVAEGSYLPEPTRSELHGVSTAGYADDVRATTFAEAHKTSWTCAKVTGHQGACVTGGPVARRLEEIERVQPAFRRAWSRWGKGVNSYFPAFTDRWDPEREGWVSVFFPAD